MKKCWNITNIRDSTIRAFGLKQLMEFLLTLVRQQAWYPDVYNREELVQCAKCGQPGETQEHLYDCADHMAVKEQFQARISMLGSREIVQREITQTAMRTLRPWNSMGWLQGRVRSEWEDMIPRLQQDRPNKVGPPHVIRRLLRASLETWYHAIWLPRCQRTIEQERRIGLQQGDKLRRMRTARRSRVDAPASPTPNLPRSFIDSSMDRMREYYGFMHRLMHGQSLT